jgi:protein-arginine kinase activator protein McsA
MKVFKNAETCDDCAKAPATVTIQMDHMTVAAYREHATHIYLCEKCARELLRFLQSVLSDY